MTVFGMNRLQCQITDLQPVAGPHLVDDPRRGLCDDAPQTDRDDELGPTRKSPKGRDIQVVPMPVADEHGREIREDVRRCDRPVTPNATGHMTEHGIREHANAVEIDKDGRMAEKRQPITHMESSCLRTLPRRIEHCDQPGQPDCWAVDSGRGTDHSPWLI
jgi:hypothetical protein